MKTVLIKSSNIWEKICNMSVQYYVLIIFSKLKYLENHLTPHWESSSDIQYISFTDWPLLKDYTAKIYKLTHNVWG
jgi:hypothetical protein